MIEGKVARETGRGEQHKTPDEVTRTAGRYVEKANRQQYEQSDRAEVLQQREGRDGGKEQAEEWDKIWKAGVGSAAEFQSRRREDGPTFGEVASEKQHDK